MGGLVFEVDLLHGQKTGFYLDQIPNYAEVAKYAAGRRVLDCFANQGAFALACARAGATQVQAIEISAECVELVRRNARRNQLQIEACPANVFDLLKDLERQQARYDMIILDPPSFTKTKGNLGDAMRGYKEIHLPRPQAPEPRRAPRHLLLFASCQPRDLHGSDQRSRGRREENASATRRVLPRHGSSVHHHPAGNGISQRLAVRAGAGEIADRGSHWFRVSGFGLFCCEIECFGRGRERRDYRVRATEFNRFSALGLSRDRKLETAIFRFP